MNTNSKKNIWHIIIGGTIGNLTEWYNFLLYGYLAPIISQLFFPTQNKLISLTLAFTVFALSFMVRPFGGILFGWIGDTYGRQRALIISLVLMAVPTTLIGFLPTYNDIGIISPILLCLFRVCQGLSAGGEHTGSAIYIAEYAPANKRALLVSTVPTSAALGILFSSSVSLIIINSFFQNELLTWGWRVGYWIGSVICLISIFLRITLPETPYFKEKRNEKSYQKYSISKLIKDKNTLKSMLMVFSLASTWGVLYQIIFIYMPTYLTDIQDLSNSIALQINIIYISFFCCLLLCVGYLADYFNRKLILRISCIAITVLAYPLFIMLSSGSLLQIYIAMGVFSIIFSLYVPTSFICMIEAFKTEFRYTGLSFSFNMGLALFGGTCPLIATWLIQITHNNLSPAFYMMIAAGIALVTTGYVGNREEMV